MEEELLGASDFSEFVICSLIEAPLICEVLYLAEHLAIHDWLIWGELDDEQ